MAILQERDAHGGTQILHRFPNGYGASQIRHDFSYGGKEGLWEIAVLKYHGEGDFDFDLCYDTDITDDVLGRLTESDVADILQQIEALPAQGE